MFRFKAIIGSRLRAQDPACPEDRGQGRLLGAEPDDPPRHANVETDCLKWRPATAARPQPEKCTKAGQGLSSRQAMASLPQPKSRQSNQCGYLFAGPDVVDDYCSARYATLVIVECHELEVAVYRISFERAVRFLDFIRY